MKGEGEGVGQKEKAKFTGEKERNVHTVVIITEHSLILEHDELDLQRTKRLKEGNDV